MAEYRTDEQYYDIVDNCINGNWTDAAEICVDGGWYANDLINRHEELKEYGETFQDETDIAILVELATELRYKKQ